MECNSVASAGAGVAHNSSGADNDAVKGRGDRDGKEPLRKGALADTRIADANVREARSVWFPRVMFSETATRGNDPVYVFGTKLRQQRFAVSDFALI